MPLDLEIVSPEKLLLSRPVDMVVIPGAEGELGVLPQHSPMIVLLRGGVIKLYEAGRVVAELFVSGGFAEITTTRVTVLANEATPLAELSRAEGEKRLAAAEQAYASNDKADVIGLDALMDQMQSARALVDAAKAA